MEWKVESQQISGITGKFGLDVHNKAGKRQTQFCQENILVMTNTFPTTQEMLYMWTWPDGKYQNWIDYVLCSQRWKSCIQSAKTKLGTDCSSDHELCIEKFTLKLKKVGKTTRPFRYELYQTPYYYTVEVINKFKGSDLVDRMSERWGIVVHNTVQNHLKEKVMQKGKLVVWGGYKNSWGKKKSEK